MLQLNQKLIHELKRKLRNKITTGPKSIADRKLFSKAYQPKAYQLAAVKSLKKITFSGYNTRQKGKYGMHRTIEYKYEYEYKYKYKYILSSTSTSTNNEKHCQRVLET